MKNIFKLSFFVILSFYLSVSYSYAEDNKNDSNSDDLIISNVMVRGADEIDVVLVDKDNKKLYGIKAKDDTYNISYTYDIIYGINEGNKLVEGDGKTPEGVYYIVSWTSGKNLVKKYGKYAEIYGAGAFPINYPNPVDRIRQKTGHGIWIHGRDPINGKDTTQGCVALHNEDLLHFDENVADVTDPVIITETVMKLSQNEYDSKRKELFNLFDTFINSWKVSDYDTFKNLIHPKYIGQGKKYSSYLSSKKHLMKKYKDKTIDTSNTKIFIQNNDNFVVDTNQFYCAENITTYTNKRYYFAKNENNLQLISEEAKSLSSYDILNASINQFIENWANAWRSGNIDNYISFYSHKFKHKRMNKDKYYEYKKNIFNNTNNITLEISDLTWSSKNNTYKVTFKQKYSGGNVSDYGTKTITFTGCPNNYKILSETWKAN